jgi:hypothetical protein
MRLDGSVMICVMVTWYLRETLYIVNRLTILVIIVEGQCGTEKLHMKWKTSRYITWKKINFHKFCFQICYSLNFYFLTKNQKHVSFELEQSPLMIWN